MEHLQLISLLLAAGCVTVRPITYPSPCDGDSCLVTGYEVWGDSEDAQSVAKKCPKSAHVSADPLGDYSVVRCYTPDTKQEAVAIVTVIKPPATAAEPPRAVEAPKLNVNDVSTWGKKSVAKKSNKRKH